MTGEDLETLSLSQRVVIGVLAQLKREGNTPAHTGEVIRAYKDVADAITADTLGRLTEAEVNRALNELEALEVVETVETRGESPVGKGRPAYAVSVSVSTIFDLLADDDRIDTDLAMVETES
jgi:Cdc6-like AAA superfamily ATPase